MENRLEICGDIIIGDPCEMVNSEEDWELCEYGSHMERLGIIDFLCTDFEEDCPEIIDNNGNILGSFCTDSCRVVIARLDDLIKYDPTFDQHLAYPENWTVIKGFEGYIEAIEIDDEMHIIGNGNISFDTIY